MHRNHLMSVALLALALTLSASAVSALMPPHVRSTEPADGGTLQGRVIVIHGYTLNGSYGKVVVTELRTGRDVPVDLKRDCKRVGKGDCAGCVQRKCVLTATLAWTRAGERYRMSLLDTQITLTAAKTLGRPRATDGAKRTPKRGASDKADSTRSAAKKRPTTKRPTTKRPAPQAPTTKRPTTKRPAPKSPVKKR